MELPCKLPCRSRMLTPRTMTESGSDCQLTGRLFRMFPNIAEQGEPQWTVNALSPPRGGSPKGITLLAQGGFHEDVIPKLRNTSAAVSVCRLAVRFVSGRVTGKTDRDIGGCEASELEHGRKESD